MTKLTYSLMALMAFSSTAAMANLENPMYKPNRESVFSKTDFNMPSKKYIDMAISEELGFGITDRLYASALLGWTFGDDIGNRNAGLSDIAMKLGYRMYNDGITFDVEGIASSDISRDWSAAYPASYGEDDSFFGFNVRMGKTIKDWTFAASLGYDFYNYDPVDLDTLHYSFEAQYRFAPKFSTNFALNRRDNDAFEETLVKAQLNYQMTSATLVSVYGTHDAEAERNSKALGFKIGVGF